jgi:hypothetical protein
MSAHGKFAAAARLPQGIVVFFTRFVPAAACVVTHVVNQFRNATLVATTRRSARSHLSSLLHIHPNITLDTLLTRQERAMPSGYVYCRVYLPSPLSLLGRGIT